MIIKKLYFISQKIMGCGISNQAGMEVKNEQIIVATLNYGGILNSPLEFFSNGQKQELQLSVIFRELIPQYFKQFNQKTFKWDVGKIDQKLQKQRYTPIYKASVGVENDKLVGAQDFIKHWNQHFQQGRKHIKIQPEPTSSQIETMRTFDLICYHTILKFLYKINSLNQIENGKHSPTQYIKLTQKYFSRSYLNQQKKIKKVRQALSCHEADVFCFQQPTKDFIQQLKKDKRFFVKQAGPAISMILLRKKSFKVINDQNYLKSRLSQNQIKQLNWDGDTLYVVCDNYIFISAHLSSKKQKNAKQVQEMKRSLTVLKTKCSDYHVIIGADTNSFVNSQGIQHMQIFPNVITQFTTRKKRTFLQPQFNKADAINEQCKDQVFSTLHIMRSTIVTIQNQQIDKQAASKKLLPTDEHPFDHFMVVCYIQKAK